MSDNDSSAQKSVLFFVLLILIAVGAIVFFLFYSSKDAGKAKVKRRPHVEETMQEQGYEEPSPQEQTRAKHTPKRGGKYNCRECKDSGWLQCCDCEGTGICPKCEGTGKIEETSFVETKHGSRNANGSKRARDDDSGGYMKRSSKLCPRKCQTCKGKGWIACRECKSSKRNPVPKPLPKQLDSNSK